MSEPKFISIRGKPKTDIIVNTAHIVSIQLEPIDRILISLAHDRCGSIKLSFNTPGDCLLCFESLAKQLGAPR